MYISKAEYDIRFTMSELEDIAYSIYYNLKHSIETHYNQLQQGQDGEPIFYDHCRERLRIMETCFCLTGLKHISDSYNEEFKKLFSDKRKEREQRFLRKDS